MLSWRMIVFLTVYLYLTGVHSMHQTDNEDQSNGVDVENKILKQVPQMEHVKMGHAIPEHVPPPSAQPNVPPPSEQSNVPPPSEQSNVPPPSAQPNVPSPSAQHNVPPTPQNSDYWKQQQDFHQQQVHQDYGRQGYENQQSRQEYQQPIYNSQGYQNQYVPQPPNYGQPNYNYQQNQDGSPNYQQHAPTYQQQKNNQQQPGYRVDPYMHPPAGYGQMNYQNPHQQQQQGYELPIPNYQPSPQRPPTQQQQHAQPPPAINSELQKLPREPQNSSQERQSSSQEPQNFSRKPQNLQDTHQQAPVPPQKQQQQQEQREAAKRKQKQNESSQKKKQRKDPQQATPKSQTSQPSMEQQNAQNYPETKQRQQTTHSESVKNEQNLQTHAKKDVKDSQIDFDDILNIFESSKDKIGPEDQPRRSDEGLIHDSSHENTNTLMEEWEKHMQNFIPDMLVTFSLSARTDEYFYENIEADNVFLRGGFFVGGDDAESSVDFTITDPDGDVVYKKSKSEGLFYFTARKKGTYSFILSNHKWMESRMVTFAVGRGAETALLPKHLDNAEAMVEQLQYQLKDIQAESSYLWIRQRSMNDTAQAFHMRLSWLAILEFGCLLITAGFHARYIIGLVSDKRIL